jgi:peptide/nickel transport system permease protein
MMPAQRVQLEKEHLIELHPMLAKQLNKGELRALCCHLEIEYDDLPGERRVDKARGLVSYLEGQNRISDLIKVGKHLRPDLPWDTRPTATRVALVTFQSMPSERLTRMNGLRRFLLQWQNLLALAIVGVYVFVAVAAPWLAPPDDPENPSPFQVATVAGRTASSRRIPIPPGPDLPLGTVSGGLDVFYSIVWGARPALRFGLVVTLAAASFGILVGAASGYAGGPVDRLTMRITDAFLTFPAIAGVFLFQQIMRSTAPEGAPTILQRVLLTLKLDPLMLALIMCSWMPYARIINANVARLKQAEYTLAARTLGANHLRIILRHLLPNSIAPAIVLAARDVGAMVVLEAAFTFIGIGGGSPWGMLLVSGRDWIVGPGGNPLAYWWVFVPATLALVFFGVGWNLLGDGLNDALNPRTVHRGLW